MPCRGPRAGTAFLTVTAALVVAALTLSPAAAPTAAAADRAQLGPPPAAGEAAVPRAAPFAAYRAENTLVDGGWAVLVPATHAVLVGVYEGFGGAGRDLNGDGDTDDRVASVWDRRWGITDLGVAMDDWGSVPIDDAGFLIVVPEGDQGVDLNGNGVVGERVAHTYQPDVGLTNLGLSTGGAVATPTGAAFAVAEAVHGDLNGDGDDFDEVVHLLDAATATVANTGLEAQTEHRIHPLAAGVVVSVDEHRQGETDLNGDGDDGDEVYQVYVPGDPIANTGVARAGRPAQLPTGELAFTVSEHGEGGDLNGDGDDADAVWHLWHPATGATNLGLAAGWGRPVVSGPRLAMGVGESGQGADLNGDGDQLDHVLHVRDPGTGIANLGLAVAGDLFGSTGAVVPLTGGFGLGVVEGAQGDADLNGDGDANDIVAHVHLTGTTNLELAYGSPASSDGLYPNGGWMLFGVPEEGRVDLNGNGSQFDTVAHTYEVGVGIANLGEVVEWLGPIPLGDGIAFGGYDDVMVHEPGAGTTAFGLRAVNPSAGSGDMLAWAVPESPDEDLNGDGDDMDDVVHVAFPNVFPIAHGDVYPVARSGTIDELAPGLLENDESPDGGDLTLELYTDPTHGSLTADEDGGFTYVHDGSAAPFDSFAYWAGDGASLSNAAEVTVVINEAPVAADDGPYLVDAGGLLSEPAPGLLANDADPDGDPIVVGWYTDPASGTADVFEDGAFTYAHDGSASLADEFTYWVTDGWWVGEETTVSIVVNQPPAAQDDGPYRVQQGGTVQGQLLANDADPNGDGLAAARASDPAHGTLTLAADGSFTYVHDGSPTTADSFTYRADDGRLRSDTATVSFAITPVDVLPGSLEAASVGLVDPSRGMWHLRDVDSGDVTSFYYGNPGDVPFLGDWDCDGTDTPGLFRTSDAYAYLRNSNTVGIADVRFFFGDPADLPLAGDFDGDGCDTLSIYRPSEQRFYIINELGADEGGLGAADYAFTFGNLGDQPVVGDWDGDGTDEVGLHRESSGFFYYRDTLSTGIADGEFFFGDPGDRFVAGDWGTVDGVETPAVFRPADTTFYFRWTNAPGVADSQLTWGEAAWLPVSGHLG